MFLDAEIEDVVQTPLLEAGQHDQGANAGIDREKSLQGKGAESLRDLPPDKALLEIEAVPCPFLTQALPDR